MAPAPTILGIGVPASSPVVPDHMRTGVTAALVAMEAEMAAFSAGWETFEVEPDIDFALVTQKLREKQWDVVMIGMGLRTIPAASLFFEQLVNAVHKELPGTQFAFNTGIDKTREACERALAKKK
ncbi:unnamed protein product [Discula destructiva]